MPTPDFSAVSYQGPLNAGGLLGPNSQRVVGRIHFAGSGGLVGTAYGFPNFSATLVGTGIVDIRTPVSPMWSVNPVIYTATGSHNYDVRIERGVGTSVNRTYAPSGIVRMAIMHSPSGARIQGNLPSGTVVDLQFDVFPTPQNGLVEF